MKSFSTFNEYLQFHAGVTPTKNALTFLGDGENETVCLQYSKLEERARAIAACIQESSAQGSRAMLLYNSGTEFIAAFLGCLFAGIIAIPAYPPRRKGAAEHVSSIDADAAPGCLLTDAKTYATLISQKSLAELNCKKWIITDGIDDSYASNYRIPNLHPDSVAFLQYTSGSTNRPKGVMVTHSNIVHNQKMIYESFRHDPSLVSVSWLPLYHDMGLIGNTLQPIFCGGSSVFFPPANFLQDPLCWLKAISKYRATTSGAPNFGYDLCVEKITDDEVQALDLSSWTLAYNGSEPVRGSTLQSFAKKFAPAGFKSASFYPCYGMAEATLLVSGGAKGKGPVTTSFNAAALKRDLAEVMDSSSAALPACTLVSCGHTWGDQQVVIANPFTQTLQPPERVGEIWLKGSNIAAGYWNQPRLTAERFNAFLADTGEGPFFRTGDLGFFSKESLYITGRQKDLIIIRGKNHYPQDIEKTVADCHEALVQGSGAAVSVDAEGQEQLLILQEIKRAFLQNTDNEAIFSAIVQAVVEKHGINVHTIALLRPGSIPKTTSGKIRRSESKRNFLDGKLSVVAQWQGEKALESEYHPMPEGSSEISGHLHSADEIRDWLVKKLSASIKKAEHLIDVDAPFERLGADSLLAIQLTQDLGTWLARRLSPTLLYDFPTIKALAAHLGQKDTHPADGTSTSFTDNRAEDTIAVVGLSCRFPGANDPDEFWELLQKGKNAVKPVPADRWDSEAIINHFADDKLSSIQWAGMLDDVSRFDPSFFGIAPREASEMDPQQRLLLEVSWEALERAGYAANGLAGSDTGVFIGISSNDYVRLEGNSNMQKQSPYWGTGNAFSIIANRLSYVLDIHGPSMAIDTACSSSLVAVHQACMSLLKNECSMALTGGVNLLLQPDLSITFAKSGMLAPDGKCKTFDAEANGYVRGEGCGIIVLKRRSDALKDGDTVHALIRGSAINQDGKSNGLTAPNGTAQQNVIRKAYRQAGVRPCRISLVEAHGTGTSLGDPIEFNSLGTVLSEDREQDRVCYVGSVKTNVGHLEAAAGIAGLIKVILALKHRVIPPQLHFKKLNPEINAFAGFQVPTVALSWPSKDETRMAGVSSFGFGGTNAHLVVEEFPPATENAEASPPAFPAVLTLSAKTEEALTELVQAYKRHFSKNPVEELESICYTSNTGRIHFEQRIAVAASSLSQLKELISSTASGSRPAHVFKGSVSSATKPGLAFVFAGQGAQFAGMGRQLYDTYPVYREVINQCSHLLKSRLNLSLAENVLYPNDTANSLFNDARYSQPALFAFEYALAVLWQSWGLVPEFLIGHSLGEYAAACLAGVFSLEDGLKLVAERGRLMQLLPEKGGMLTVFAGEEPVRRAIAPFSDAVAVAALNSKEQTVISGKTEALEKLNTEFRSLGVKTIPLTVSHAFHSPLLLPMISSFESVARGITYHKPKIKVISNVSGRLADEEFAGPDYWCNHTLATVRFADGIEELKRQGCNLFLEIGPKPTTTALGKAISPLSHWIPSFTSAGSGLESIASGLGRLFAQGLSVNWQAVYNNTRIRKTALPTYPFQKQRYWIEDTTGGFLWPGLDRQGRRQAAHPLLGEQLLLAEKERTIFSSRLNGLTPSFLRDHRVYDQIIFPGTGYIEILLAAAKRVFGADAVTVEGLLIPQALLLSENENVLVQTCLGHKGGQQYSADIYSLKGEQGDADWLLHASCTVSPQRQEETGFAITPLDELQVKCNQQVSVEQLYQRYTEIGIQYGRSFQAIRELWTGADCALSRIEFSGATNNFQLHPVLLDAAFHTLAAAVPPLAKQNAFMPVSIDALHFYQLPSKEVWSFVQFYKSLRNSIIEVDVQVMDAAGRLVAVVKKLKLKEVQQSVPAVAGQVPMDWTYELSWTAQNETTAVVQRLPPPATILEEVQEYIESQKDALAFADYQSALKELESLSPQYVLQAFEELGVEFVPGKKFSQHDFMGQYGVTQTQSRFLNRLFQMLEEESVLERSGRDWKMRSLPTTDFGQKRTGGVNYAFSGIHTEAALLHRCGSALAPILRGEADPVQILFGDEENNAGKLYDQSVGARLMNDSLQEVLKKILAHTGPGTPLRILEIGAGTGATTACILPPLADLPHGQIEFLFTDISSGFFAKAKEKFQHYPFVSYQTLDIEKDPAAQGFEYGQFHLVIAANVLHATKGLHESISHIRSLLSKNGLLLLLEGTAKSKWIDLVFGSTEGWWKFRDAELRKAHPLISTDQWRQILEEHQFDVSVCSPATSKEEEAVSQQSIIMARAAERPATAKEHWVLLADKAGTANAMVNAMRNGHCTATLVLPDEGIAEWAFTGSRYAINPDNATAYQSLFRHLSAKLPITKLVHLWSTDLYQQEGTFPERMAAAKKEGCHSLLHLVKALEPLPELIFVTKACHPIEGNPGLNALIQSPFLGMTRILALEHPLVKCRNIDLDANATAAEDAETLLQEITSPLAEGQISFRNGTRYVRRLIRKDTAPGAPIEFSGEKCYMITGGTGHLGLLTAKWMAQKGAKHLALVSRSGATSSLVQRDIRELEQAGIEVSVFCADTGNLQEMEAVFERLRQHGLPLAGVVHAAGIAGFAAIREMETGDLDAVFEAKVYGAWNVHQLTEDMNLDFFICYSSASSVWGSKGHGHYAAANHFLDILAHYRKGIGLPALTVNWALWSGGMVSSTEQRQLEQLGLRAMEPDKAFRILEALLAGSSAQVTIADLDWSLFKTVFETKFPYPLFKQIAVVAKPAKASFVLDEIKALPVQERQNRLKSHVQELVGSVLGYTTAQTVDENAGLFDVGIDSLTGIELIGQLQKSLGCSLPSTLIFKYPTVASLAHFLNKEFFSPEETEPEPAPPVVIADTPATIALDGLSNDELALRLARKLHAIQNK